MSGSGDSRDEAGESTIQVIEAPDESTVAVTGRITVDSSPQLRVALLQLLRRSKAPAVVIDFSAVSYVDMSGIATLIEGLKPARERSITLRLVGMGGQVKALAEVAQLDKIFHLWGSEVEST